MSEHNSRDCAALVSLTVEKQLAAKYRDMQCLLPVEEIQVQGSLFFYSKNLFFSKTQYTGFELLLKRVSFFCKKP